MPEVESTGSEAGTTLGEVGVEVEVAIMTPHRRMTTHPRLHTVSPLPTQANKDGDLVSGLELLAVPLQDIWQGIGETRIKQRTQAILTINVTTVVFLIVIMEKEALYGEVEGERDHLLFLRLGMKAPDLGRQIEDSLLYINACWA